MARSKVKKQTRGRLPKRGLPWFVWLGIALAAACVIAFVAVFLANRQTGLSDSGELKAAIVDQLYDLQPNEDFIRQVTEELEGHGFKVDLYQGDKVTVDLYRSLPANGYGLIIFRTHSGLLSHKKGSQIEVTRATCLFTNEEYSETKHVKEQLNGELARARISQGYPLVFALGARFTGHSMKSEFNNTVIIIMGCHGITLYDLAKAFIDKGASSYLAWDGLVGLHYVDEATLYLVRQLCTEGTTIGDAVAGTMSAVGADPAHNARLKYYPLESGSKTISQLIE